MAAPVLVREYSGRTKTKTTSRVDSDKALPPISSFAFVNIIQTSDGPDFQSAIDGIAEICAKNRMSLADEYGSHLPPLGTITTATPASIRQQLSRPGMRRALTSVPEGSSGSSEDSRKGVKKVRELFSFKRQRVEQSTSLRTIKIGSMGRTVSATALASATDVSTDSNSHNSRLPSGQAEVARPGAARRPSLAEASLQRILGTAG